MCVCAQIWVCRIFEVMCVCVWDVYVVAVLYCIAIKLDSLPILSVFICVCLRVCVCL